MSVLFRIIAPHFVAGVILGVRAAPIIGYMANWNEQRIRIYCAKKRWRLEIIE